LEVRARAQVREGRAKDAMACGYEPLRDAAPAPPGAVDENERSPFHSITLPWQRMA
jgi:hypothetical protein